MNPISPIIKLHTKQESIEAGIQIRSLILEHKGNNYHLQGSTTDTIHVFTQGVGIYVLTINKELGYVVMNSYMAPEPDPINSAHLRNNKEIRETLGPKWEAMNPRVIALRLMDYLY